MDACGGGRSLFSANWKAALFRYAWPPHAGSANRSARAVAIARPVAHFRAILELYRAPKGVRKPTGEEEEEARESLQMGWGTMGCCRVSGICFRV